MMMNGIERVGTGAAVSRILLLTLWLFTALSGVAVTPPTPAPRTPDMALKENGIATDQAALIAFLEGGFPPGVNLSKLPVEPKEKSQLAVNAMSLLAQMKAAEAVPVLSQIALRNPPKGVVALIEKDLERTAPDSRMEFQNKALRILQFNAINALGYIGDTSAIAVIRKALSSEQSPAAGIQYALALACLGDAAGVDFLVQQILLENRRESAAAANAFYYITNKDFGYTENTALRMRKPKARAYRDWWKQNRESFQVDRKAVLERRLKGKPADTYEPRSTRDLLRVAANYFDFDNKQRSRDAREKLNRAGKSLNPELEKIALDTSEDLNVRLEAMNWFYEFNRAASKSLLKKLRRDENPEIADKANVLLGQIEQDSQGASVSVR
jgi:hypothetical protein